MSTGPIRAALVYHGLGGPFEQQAQRAVRTLASALHRDGHRPTLVGSRTGLTERGEEAGIPFVAVGRLPEGGLRYRGFATPLTHVPATVLELLRGRYDVVHAFSPADALAARLWRRRSGSAVVYTPVEPTERERLADRRLRLALVSSAITGADAMTAASEEDRDAVWKWLAVDVPLISPDDAGAHVELYRRLVRDGASPA